jgi:amidase
VELLDFLLARIERLNPAVNAVIALDAEGARARAREADAARARGERWGPLHGLPLTVKDALEVAGMPTTSGAPELAQHHPPRTAPSVARLVEAGAIVFGKTNLPLYAGDFQTTNALFGTTRNPWNPQRSCGGSSGGAAVAVATGMTPLEVGSDIGGSIRNPAHCCGVYGHKPSYGLVPPRGHVPGPPGQLRRTDINVVGPLARDPQDLALALDLMAGPDDEDAVAWHAALPPSRADVIEAFRVGVWLDDPACPVDREVGDVLQAAVDALARRGVFVRDDARPAIDPAESHETYLQLLYAELAPGFPKPMLEAMDAALPGLAPDDRSLVATAVRGGAQRHRDWIARDERRHQMRARWAELFRDVDVLLCPVLPTVAIPHDEREFTQRTITVNGQETPYMQLAFWAGLTGGVYLPSTVAPVGLSRSGLPVGVQIVGPYLEDRTTLRFAALLADVVEGFTPPPGFA